MAAPKTRRTLRFKLPNVNEVSSTNDIRSPNKDMQRLLCVGELYKSIKKTFDMLGPRWIKGELERFYEAYRKHGQDWKKVAGVLRNRSIENVEALYTMNRAYLSLPEGTASVVGLIAMMTDHYNALEGRDREQEINDSRISQKRARAEVLKEDRQEITDASKISQKPQKHAHGKAPLVVLKGRQQPNSVTSGGGRLSFLKERLVSGSHPLPVTKKRTPRYPISESCSKIDCEKSVLLINRDHNQDTDASWDKVAHMAPVALVDVSQRGDSRVSQAPQIRTENSEPPAVKRKKRTVLIDSVYHFDGIPKEKLHPTVMDKDCLKNSSAGMEAENRYHFDEEELIVAECMVSMVQLTRLPATPPIKTGLVASVPSKEGAETLDTDNKLNEPKGISGSATDYKIKRKYLDVKEKYLDPVSGDRVITYSRKPKLGRDLRINRNALSEAEHQSQCSNKALKRKQKSFNSKDLVEEEGKSENKNEPMNQTSTLALEAPKRCSDSEKKTGLANLAVVTAEATATNQVSSFTKRKSKRKSDSSRMLVKKDANPSTTLLKDQIAGGSLSPQNRALNIKEQLSHCLSSYLVRRWCCFEWFYSAIDYPWFSGNAFMEFLNHAQVGHVPKLTRREWCIIKSTLGRPRRFSEHFLAEEREKLEQSREELRKRHAEIRAGVSERLPTDLVGPLSVGQLVIARHPKTREVHNGSILSVDHDKCRVQFVHPELGVEFVADNDCMPLDLVKGIPRARRRDNVPVNNLCWNTKDSNANLQSNIEETKMHAAVEHPQVCSDPLHLLHPNTAICNPPSCCESLEPGSNVVEIIKDSQVKAQSMVHTAIQAMSTMSEGEDPFERIGCALDPLNDAEPATSEVGASAIRSCQELSTHSTANVSIPAELITSCVSTLLMVQRCSQQQYPPGDVAHVLNYATATLRPHCPQNLSIYSDIQKHMGLIKNQLLALVPPSNPSL